MHCNPCRINSAREKRFCNILLRAMVKAKPADFFVAAAQTTSIGDT